MSDLIDREEALKAITFGALSAATIYGRTEEGMMALKETIRVIKALPSAQTERAGKWLLVDGYRCSKCNYKLQTTGLPSYCPNCGARMEH